MSRVPIEQMIHEVLKHSTEKDRLMDPSRVDELVAWCRAYYPNGYYKAESIARVARNLREERQNNSWPYYSVENPLDATLRSREGGVASG